jgi:hypothetical protein
MSLAHSLAKSSERRHSQRRLINRVAKIQLATGTLPPGDGLAQECNYQVVWRLGHEIGARFMGVVRRSGTTRG